MAEDVVRPPGSVTYLLQQAGEGDAEAFRRLVERYEASIKALARRVAGARLKGSSSADWEDIHQELFLDLCGRKTLVASASDRVEFEKLLYVATRRRVLKSLQFDRAGRRDVRRTRDEARTVLPSGESFLPTLADSRVDSDPAEEAERCDLIREIEAHLALVWLKLGPKMVEVFRDYLRGSTAEESAERLGVSANTVRRHREGLHNSLAKWFRLELDATEEEPPGTSPDRAIEPQ